MRSSTILAFLTLAASVTTPAFSASVRGRAEQDAGGFKFARDTGSFGVETRGITTDQYNLR
jgi:hypothetical protein